MRSFVLFSAATIGLLIAVDVCASPIRKAERDLQNEIWERWWGSKLEWRFDELPEKGKVEKFRMPYAGSIYPDKNGGTGYVLRKYDRAFYGRSAPASSFEKHDIAIHKEEKRLLFLRRRKTPDWAGHCNGWSAAAIRHAEPTRNVVRNGVVFAPSDIKGLLAELYTYTDIEELGGSNGLVHPATMHVMLANWLGFGKHPIAMDEATDEEVWNYPIYAYTSSSAKRGDRRVEVKTNIGYVHYTRGEYDEAPENYRFLYFHYSLDLNADGEIVGGYYYRDSNQIDLLWVPLQATKGGQPGNEPGNPYLSVKQVLSMWRESAPEELRKKWFNINPTSEDKIVEPEPVAEDDGGTVVSDDTAEEDDATETPEGVEEADEVESPSEVTGETPEDLETEPIDEISPEVAPIETGDRSIDRRGTIFDDSRRSASRRWIRRSLRQAHRFRSYR